jgi:SecD/SecF fusion protein
VVRDPLSGQPEIDFTMDSKGAELFAQITKENIGKQLAIVLDGELYSAPVIQGEIPGGRGRITGTFTPEEAIELANVLENPLETPVKIIEERRVDPSLGKDSIRSGIIASAIGTGAVVVFMLCYYLFAGVVSIIALLLNVVILLGVMCSVGTTLTIPGIAGIVLTIGMAVDANVLIYERIREELEAGKSIRGAISAGYDKAFGTIFDSNLTTLISSVILIFMGTGPVKGFGVSLTIGLCVSMFTALVVTRLIFDWLLAKGWIKKLPMFHLVRAKNLDFMRWAKPAFLTSWTLIVIGCGYGIYRGNNVLGVDFAGGDSVTLGLTQKVPMDQVRDVIEKKAGVTESTIQYQTDLSRGGKETLRMVVPFGKGEAAEKALQEQFPQSKFAREQLDQVGPTVGQEIQRTAVVATLLALFGILVYVAMRYEFSFAIGAVFAILHDIFMTIGLFCLTGRQFNAPMVAAILTIIGFSINDTIVIFDRIREDLKLGIRGTFREVMNKALNQTLSRTIITSGTVFLATMSLYLFGGAVINDFAYTFLVGIITGTYSSIYMASAFVIWWHKGERPKIGAAQVALETSA